MLPDGQLRHLDLLGWQSNSGARRSQVQDLTEPLTHLVCPILTQVKSPLS